MEDVDYGFQRGYEFGLRDGRAQRGPIAVTVDDEHAQPVTGWVLRLPEEMGAVWMVSRPWATYAIPTCADHLRNEAISCQRDVAYFRTSSPSNFRIARHYYAHARWWAAAYRTVLREEQQ